MKLPRLIVVIMKLLGCRWSIRKTKAGLCLWLNFQNSDPKPWVPGVPKKSFSDVRLRPSWFGGLVPRTPRHKIWGSHCSRLVAAGLSKKSMFRKWIFWRGIHLSRPSDEFERKKNQKNPIGSRRAWAKAEFCSDSFVFFFNILRGPKGAERLQRRAFSSTTLAYTVNKGMCSIDGI